MRLHFDLSVDSVAARRLEATEDSLARVIAGDTAKQHQAAIVLATGIARWDGEASRFASVLYEAWGLPPAPARAVLRDRDETVHARRWAASALVHYAKSQWFNADALEALCDLGGRAAGELRVWGVNQAQPSAGIHRLDGLLDYEERDLLVLLLEGLTREPADPGLPAHVSELLGSDNPVTEYVVAYWRQFIAPR